LEKISPTSKFHFQAAKHCQKKRIHSQFEERDRASTEKKNEKEKFTVFVSIFFEISIPVTLTVVPMVLDYYWSHVSFWQIVFFFKSKAKTGHQQKKVYWKTMYEESLQVFSLRI
jgi:hypothetical protein